MICHSKQNGSFSLSWFILVVLSWCSMFHHDGSSTLLVHAETTSDDSIVDVAKSDPENSFSTLVSLLETTNLDQVLGDPYGYANSWLCRSGWFPAWFCPTYTVFAPDNTAFDEAILNNAVLGKMVDKSDDYILHLADVLKFHVVSGTVKSTDIQNDQVISTLSTDNTLTAKVVTLDGSETSIQLENPSSSLTDNAKVVSADIMASNGVVHVIDQVLIPISATKTIAQLALDTPSLSELVAALTEADLVDTLNTAGATFTVFAPTNTAFQSLYDALGPNVNDVQDIPLDILTDVLLYHVHSDSVVSQQDLLDLLMESNDYTASIDTALTGESITVSFANSRLAANGKNNQNHRSRWWNDKSKKTKIQLNNQVNIISYDILASNGIIHVIDTVLQVPAPTPTIADLAVSLPDQFSTLVEALTRADLVETLNDTSAEFTVFAPTNDAFDDLLNQLGVSSVDDIDSTLLSTVLLYHVNQGIVKSSDLQDGQILTPLTASNVLVDVSTSSKWWWYHDPQESIITLNTNSKVIDANIEASNGIIHVIDRVLLPPNNIVDIIESEFSILQTALTTAELLETLESAQFTILAPTNEAFTKLGQETLDFLLSDDGRDALIETLLYHVIPGQTVPSAKIQTQEEITLLTAQGKSVTLEYTKSYWWKWWSYKYDESYTIKDTTTKIDELDILASNGILHSIDEVLSVPE